VTKLPFPPSDLRERVFASREPADSNALYESSGRHIADAVERTLPADFSWDGARVLEFASGAGRVLRHLLADHPEADWWCCDVHQPSIDWLQHAGGLELHAVQCQPRPPLPFDDNQFDLVYGISAFTHIGWDWAEWIAEMQRIIRPGGLLVVSLLGEEVHRFAIKREPPPDDAYGLLVYLHGNPPENNGPVVFQSDWWLRAHWGRAFEIDSYDHDSFAVGVMQDGREHLQSMLAARAREERKTVAQLLAPEPDEPREFTGLMAAIAAAADELAEFHRLKLANETADAGAAATRNHAAALRALLARARGTAARGAPKP
jgi:SAM-dependent methyltransferase